MKTKSTIFLGIHSRPRCQNCKTNYAIKYVFRWPWCAKHLRHNPCKKYFALNWAFAVGEINIKLYILEPLKYKAVGIYFVKLLNGGGAKLLNMFCRSFIRLQKCKAVQHSWDKILCCSCRQGCRCHPLR